MKHPDEQTIEKIAIALCVDGCSRGWEGTTRLNVPLARSLDHVRSCARCREILETLIETEEAWRAGAADVPPGPAARAAAEPAIATGLLPGALPADAPAARILPLRPWQARPAPLTGRTSDGRDRVRSGGTDSPPGGQAEEAPEPALAAADASLRPAQARILTLVTDDDRYLVRIHGDALGEGATAILVVSQELSPAGEPAYVPVLRVDQAEFEFDATNMARPPRFPAAEVSLVLRERR